MNSKKNVVIFDRSKIHRTVNFCTGVFDALTRLGFIDKKDVATIKICTKETPTTKSKTICSEQLSGFVSNETENTNSLVKLEGAEIDFVVLMNSDESARVILLMGSLFYDGFISEDFVRPLEFKNFRTAQIIRDFLVKSGYLDVSRCAKGFTQRFPL